MEDSKPNQNTDNQIVTMAQIEHMFQLFQQMNKKNQTIEPLASELKVAEKLNYHNYTKLCKFMHIAIEARGRLEHITCKPPNSTDPTYEQWK